MDQAIQYRYFYGGFGLFMGIAMLIDLTSSAILQSVWPIALACAFACLIIALKYHLGLLLEEDDSRVIKKSVLRLLFSAYCIALGFLLFFSKSFGRGISIGNNVTAYVEYFQTHSNLIPFASVAEFSELLAGGHVILGLYNLLGNLAAFAAFGYFLPVLFRRMQSWKWFIGTMAFLIAAVETLQILFMAGIFDVDDWILNMCGAVVVYSIYKAASRSTLQQNTKKEIL